MNAYATLDMLKSPSALNIRGVQHDDRLRATIENVSRQVDGYCNRHFYTLSATRYFDGDGSGVLRVPDLIAVDGGGLSTDDDHDRQYAATWSESDYHLYPANADPAGGHDSSGPYTSVVVDSVAGARRRFPVGPLTVRIAGQWGFWRRLRSEASLIAPIDADESRLYVSSQYGIKTGHTALVETEQMYVRETAVGSAAMTRGVNGTVAAPHPSGAQVSVFEYPGPVTEAALLQAARLWRRSAASTSELDIPTPGGLDPDVQALIGLYRKISVGIT